MKKRHGSCICHDKLRSLNAKGLCPIGAKKAREKSAESKGILTKSARNNENIAKLKSEYDGADNARRNKKIKNKCIQSPREKVDAEKQLTKTKVYKINPMSKDKATELRTLATIKKRKIDLQGLKCEMCGKHGEVDLFHIITVGNKKFSTNSANLILSCRECHEAKHSMQPTLKHDTE